MKRLLCALVLVFSLIPDFVIAQSETAVYQLIGKVLQDDGHPFCGVTPIVILAGATTPFEARTLADASGKFKFKNLFPGMFTLILYIPRSGELTRTVEVGPSLADKKRRVLTTLVFQRNSAAGLLKVSALELSIPDSAKNEYQKSQEKLGKRDIAAAIAHLKKSVEIAPQFCAAWNTLGTIAYQSGQLTQAETYFREALKHDPDYYPSVVNLGGALLTQGRTLDALPMNLQAVKARPDDALAHSQLGQTYFFLGQAEEAEKYLKQAVSLDPGHFTLPQLFLAEIYMDRQDFSSMAIELEQCLRLHPDAVKTRRFQKLLSVLRKRDPS